MAKKRAIVVGGGLAGLTAGAELAQAGFQVTVLEKERRCGGKLASWPHPATGTFVEHGMHGWWRNYTNFFDLMQRVGIASDTVLRRSEGSTIVWCDGQRRRVTPVRWPAPLFLLGYLLRARVPWVRNVVPLVRAALALLAFEPTRDYRRLDGMSMRAWLKAMGVSRDVERAFFEPYVRSFAFDSADNISAAAVLSAYHFYLVRHHDDIVANWLVGDPDTLITTPMVDYIKTRCGEVVCENKVKGLWLDNTGGVKGVIATNPLRRDGVECVDDANGLPGCGVEAEHVVLAVDVENCRTLIPEAWKSKEELKGIRCLDTTPVLVARLWFKGAGLLGDATTGVFVDYPLLDNFFVLSNLQEEFRNLRDTTAIEVQGYMVDDMVGWGEKELLAVVLRDLCKAFECLRGAELRCKPEVKMHKDSFAHQGPNTDQLRPDTCTGVNGLYLAGDWVNRSPAVWHMERAVVSGKLAANAVLKATNGRAIEVCPMRKSGWLFRGCVALARIACKMITGWGRAGEK